MYRYGILTHVEDGVPSLRCGRLKVEGGMSDKSTTYTFRIGLRVVRIFRQTERIDCVACQGLGWFSAVNEDGFHSEECERSSCNEFGFLIAIHEG